MTFLSLGRSQTPLPQAFGLPPLEWQETDPQRQPEDQVAGNRAPDRRATCYHAGASDGQDDIEHRQPDDDPPKRASQNRRNPNAIEANRIPHTIEIAK